MGRTEPGNLVKFRGEGTYHVVSSVKVKLYVFAADVWQALRRLLE